MSGHVDELLAAPHVHKWVTASHEDYCHKYAWTSTCSCGASRRDEWERDVREDGYSAVWMDPEGREPCPRCEQLLSFGAKPRGQVTTIVEPGEPRA